MILQEDKDFAMKHFPEFADMVDMPFLEFLGVIREQLKGKTGTYVDLLLRRCDFQEDFIRCNQQVYLMKPENQKMFERNMALIGY